MKAIVLLSGGLDSATTAALAISEGYDVHALSFDYAQRHRVELESARIVAKSLGIQNHLFIKFNLGEIGGSALTADIEVPKDRIGGHGEAEIGRKSGSSEVIPVTYVPARNTIFLSFALSWAEVLEAPHIFIGANAIDYSGYPDCRPEYFASFETTANLSTKISVEGRIHFTIHTPLITLSKAEIIREGVSLGLDFAQTWSCYDPQGPARRRGDARPWRGTDDFAAASPRPRVTVSGFVPCRRCDSCLLRAKGFREAGVADPLDRMLFPK